LNTIYRPMLAALALAGCASPAPVADTLMTLPREQVFEVRYDTAVAAPVAYKNILERAARCWQDRSHLLFAESFSSRTGSARMSVRYRGYGFRPQATVLVIEVARATEDGTRLGGRTLAANGAYERDLRNLQLWAEGKTSDCG
jgi:hypothetical protein